MLNFAFVRHISFCAYLWIGIDFRDLEHYTSLTTSCPNTSWHLELVLTLSLANKGKKWEACVRERRTEQDRTQHNTTGQDRTHQNRTEQDKTE
jgi:hypothetical protein